MFLTVRPILAREFFQQIGNAVEILAISKACELDARRLGAPQARFARVKRVINVFRDVGGVFACATAGFVIRHVPFDVTCEPFQRTFSLKRTFELALNAFAVFPVAFGALLIENLRTS